VARRTGCRVQISHLAAVGRRNWGRVGTVLDEIDRANDDGCDIGVDCYPYLAGSAPMSQLLPAWVHDGGEDLMRSRLSRPDLRRAIDDAWAGAHFDWADIVLTALPAAADAADRASVGRTVVQIAADRDRRAAAAAMDLLGDYGHGVLMVAFGRDERDLRTVLGHPRSMVASDGLAIDPAGVTGSAGLPHPRSFGCFPRFLSEYCADLADGIRRCTAAPADRVGLVDRGRIADGVPADLVVFDPATLADAATYQAPQRFPAGIALVMVNGQVVVEDGHRMSARPGSTLRAGGAATRRSTDKPEVLPPGGRC
jgi:N-acyl-D-amino-acid deacylase